MRGLEGKHAVVTGGGGAIGRAICLRLAEEGCRIAVFDMNEARAAETQRAVEEAGGRAGFHLVDISDHEAVRAGVAEARRAGGEIDILVNNAGWDRFANFLDTDPALWDRIVAINLRGPLNMHHAILPGMVAAGTGRVVNIASDAGRVGSSGEAVYSACKGGVIAFTKTMARELARTGITLNAVCPGPTDTPLLRSFFEEGEAGEKIVQALERAIPMKRLGRAEDLPGIVAFLASEDAAFITGQTISVSGGLTMHG
jgi:2-hydroxycyclohexanecarboxyl-CoA dehydrogenase